MDILSDTRKKPKLLGYAKYGSFGSYLKGILGTSLITSFPVIAKSKNWIKRVIKIVVFTMCLIGFVYQTMDFMQMYWSFPTVVNVFLSDPYEIVQPAVTVCNTNRKRRSFLCSRPDNFCYFEKPEEFCKNYPLKCPGNDPKLAFPGLPNANLDVRDMYYDWNDTIAGSHNDTTIKECKNTIEENEFKCPTPFRRVPFVDSKGQPNMCITIDSLVDQPDAEDTVYPNTYILQLVLNTQAEEYVVFTDYVLLQVKFHDRRALVNPFTEGSSLEAGLQYHAYLSMSTIERLPAPYDTNCFDYVEEWKRNNGTGPLNYLSCVEHCKLQTLLEMGECIDKDVDYPHTEELCDPGLRSMTNDIVKDCMSECRNPCYDATYEVKYEKMGETATYCFEKDPWCKLELISVDVLYNKFRLTRHVYQPKFASVEMFSYIGGYMGMWLGLSLVSIFDLYETICFLLFYPIGRMRLKAKKEKIQSAFARGLGTKKYI